ncbi:YifB family Mg chelatase-like AAA ATPase [Pseudoalteromonas sp. JBTF-M23]|uniref:YifB family Mg chelatase-like AAA ATPase n=1 Tax=Pseudoalteromonas caenipelagi TaxID=2726988 RepID=A0A849VHZ8_9GAMM|nr:YifB family Mg chelatase-like AAA ATPase [Pseudoalteromonas caenipelagi]NOU53032.1 YifB family Mg chelatase-like AAA ATPase [Pseudoalteromonas caenipelagi]
MSLAKIYTRAQVGIDAPQVSVEVHLSNGLPAFHIVGLPETSVKEAKERVRSALTNSRFLFPEQRITVNLSPADLPKEGGRYDLAIAVGILVASGQLVSQELTSYEFYGELALSGEVLGVHAVLPCVLAAEKAKRCCYLPVANDELASLAPNANRKAVPSLEALWLDMQGQQSLPLNQAYQKDVIEPVEYLDMDEVKGQESAKRVLEIAAAGGHNLLFLGPPGTGKSMLAQRMPTIMPALPADAALETASVYSLIGQHIDMQNWCRRPFRSPHHTCSAVALVGGSSKPKPGEISLAHNGVLFLDELPEFERKVLDSLREPMETGQVTISRAARQVDFPARFQLIAALNPSPTGNYDDKRATADQVLKYLSKISGPFIDRIDLQIELPRLSTSQLQSEHQEESSAQIKQRVEHAYMIALRRQNKSNAMLNNRELLCYCALGLQEKHYLAKAVDKLQLSPRSYHRILKVARTIADLSAEPNITLKALQEALSYRAFERLISQLTRY